MAHKFKLTTLLLDGENDHVEDQPIEEPAGDYPAVSADDRVTYTASLPDDVCRWIYTQVCEAEGKGKSKITDDDDPRWNQVGTPTWRRRVHLPTLLGRYRDAKSVGHLWPRKWRQGSADGAVVLPLLWATALRDADDLDKSAPLGHASYALLMRANKQTGVVEFSQTVLAGDWGVHRHTISRGINALSAAGWIEVIPARASNGSQSYRLIIPARKVPVMPPWPGQ